MIPDLRFVIRAVIATALLSMTAYGFGAAVHVAHQGKVAPLEAARALAYMPHDVRIDRFGRGADNPFANVPVSPEGMRPAPPLVLAAADPPAEAAPVAADAVTETAAPAAGDHDTVDERAVIDPPLPLDSEQAAEPIETTAAPAQAAPSQSLSAARVTPITTAPPALAENPGEPAREVEHVGSVASITAAPDQVDAPPPALAIELRQVKKAKAKPAARKPKARPRPRTTVARPAASTGYPVSASGFPAMNPIGGFFPLPAASRANTAKPLWRGD